MKRREYGSQRCTRRFQRVPDQWCFQQRVERRTGQSAHPGHSQEFQLLTLNNSAEFGNSAGAITNLVTKSGTNQWHGSLGNPAQRCASTPIRFLPIRPRIPQIARNRRCTQPIRRHTRRSSEKRKDFLLRRLPGGPLPDFEPGQVLAESPQFRGSNHLCFSQFGGRFCIRIFPL